MRTMRAAIRSGFTRLHSAAEAVALLLMPAPMGMRKPVRRHRGAARRQRSPESSPAGVDANASGKQGPTPLMVEWWPPPAMAASKRYFQSGFPLDHN
jgi:hypothetical protein